MTQLNQADYSPPNVNYWGDRCCKAEAENERLRAALEEIAGDPTGVSAYQADIAKRALGIETDTGGLG